MTKVNVTEEAEEQAKEMILGLRTPRAKEQFKAELEKQIKFLEDGFRLGRKLTSPSSHSAKEVVFYDGKALMRYDEPADGEDYVEIFDFMWSRNNH